MKLKPKHTTHGTDAHGVFSLPCNHAWLTGKDIQAWLVCRHKMTTAKATWRVEKQNMAFQSSYWLLNLLQPGAASEHLMEPAQKSAEQDPSAFQAMA